MQYGNYCDSPGKSEQSVLKSSFLSMKNEIFTKMSVENNIYDKDLIDRETTIICEARCMARKARKNCSHAEASINKVTINGQIIQWSDDKEAFVSI